MTHALSTLYKVYTKVYTFLMKFTTIQKWGNSYAVRLPKESVDRLELTEGQAMHIEETQDGKGISLIPAARAQQSLAKLLAQVTPKNLHQQTDWGAPVGNEIW